jgi:hypothetical protein
MKMAAVKRPSFTSDPEVGYLQDQSASECNVGAQQHALALPDALSYGTRQTILQTSALKLSRPQKKSRPYQDSMYLHAHHEGHFPQAT